LHYENLKNIPLSNRYSVYDINNKTQIYHITAAQRSIVVKNKERAINKEIVLEESAQSKNT